MAGRGFSSGRGESLQKYFDSKKATHQISTQESHTTSNDASNMSRPMGRGLLFQSSDERPSSQSSTQSPSSQSTTSRPIGRGQLFGFSGSSTQNGVSGTRQNGVVPLSQPSGPFGAGRGNFLQKLQNDIAQSSSSSSSAVPSPPGSRSPDESLMSDLRLSDSPTQPLQFRGETGEQVSLITNYIRLDTEPDRAIFQYDVRFQPEVDSKQMRIKLLRQLHHVLHQTTNFDGAILYLPIKLPDKVTEKSVEMQDGSPGTVRITLVKQMRMGDRNCIHLYNVLFRRIMTLLGYVEHGRNFYDPNTAKTIPEHKLSVWPGVITAIQEFEDGVMLMCDASHRVLREQTVLELMEDLIIRCAGRDDWKEEFQKLVAGQTVLTYYNNKVYRLDDVVFDKSPRDDFLRNGQKISYIQYYRQQYDVEVTDFNQPLLMSKVKSKVRGQTIEGFVYLIPELCYLSGITDVMRNDFQVMKSIAHCTRIAPGARQLLLEKFLTTLNSNTEARKILENWGLRLSNKSIILEGRVLPPETVYAANKQGTANHDCNWTSHVTNKGVISAIHIHGWSIVCTRHDERNVRDMAQMFQEVGRRMGIDVRDPDMKLLSNDNLNNYLLELKRLSGQQIVVIVLPLARKDKYESVKRVCCLENPIPSQVVIARTIRDKKKLRSIAQKILLQMNCKLGGTLWAVPIPLKNVMVIGLDTFHDATRRSNSVGAVVASLNSDLTRWYSRIYRQDVGQELIDGFEIAITQCLKRYEQITGALPTRLVIYRDGLGDGQLETCSMFEVNQLKRACMRHAPDYNPELLFVVVQKRIQTRMCYKRGRETMNAPPGTVMDHTVTRRDKQDFFLVSQNVTQGTVTPTHYVILNNTTNMSPDKIQRFTYKLTHLYYNWTGTIRVPAPCQYAHKLASLVGEHLGGREADDSLRDKLFYL